MGIGAIIGIAASLYQAVQTYKRADAEPSKTDQLFTRLDTEGKGAINGADLQTAFDRIATEATIKADSLFDKLDADANGQVTKSEFSSAIDRLTQELDDHFTRLRMKVETPDDVGLTREELSGAAASLASRFDQVDANGNGRVTVGEAIGFLKKSPDAVAGAGTQAEGSSKTHSIELMLQVMRLMQTYGSGSDTAAAKGSRISTAA